MAMPRLALLHDWPRVVFTLRSRRNETQGEFAKALDCAESTVSKWERGETAPKATHRRVMEKMGADCGYPSSDWPEESKQPPLFPGSPR